MRCVFRNNCTEILCTSTIQDGIRDGIQGTSRSPKLQGDSTSEDIFAGTLRGGGEGRERELRENKAIYEARNEVRLVYLDATHDSARPITGGKKGREGKGKEIEIQVIGCD